MFVFIAMFPGRGIKAERRLESIDFPRTLKAEPALVPKLEEMLRLSPTFRAQCLRLDADGEKLSIVLRLNPTLPKGLFRARSTLRRYTSGLLVADVEVAQGSNQAEWIAHEFEHVLELLDGRNLRSLARERAEGVWHSVDGMVETGRATEAGRMVLLETNTIDVSDKFVE